VKGEVPTLDLIFACHKADNSPIVKLLLSRVGKLGGAFPAQSGLSARDEQCPLLSLPAQPVDAAQALNLFAGVSSAIVSPPSRSARTEVRPKVSRDYCASLDRFRERRGRPD